jgi:organic hydroperoxide reductase OsmC/OhrA
MTPLPHHYHVELTGTPAGCVASSAGVPDMTIAPPTQYDGPGDTWCPEQMLLSAVAACFVFTFRAVARAMKTPFVSVDVSASGTVAKAAGVVRFVEIVLYPRITVPAGSDRDRLLTTVDQSENRCLVAASLSVPVRVEMQVVEVEAATDARQPVQAVA